MTLRSRPLDVRFVTADSSAQAYQQRSADYAAIEPPTKHCNVAAVLRFREAAWQTYFTRPEYLALVERKFDPPQRPNVEAMTKIKLRRKLLGD